MTCLHRSHLFLCASALLGASLSIPACLVGAACTEIGCVDGVSIRASIAGAADDPATVRVLDDGVLVAEFDCPAAGEPCPRTDDPAADGWVERPAAGELVLTAVGAGTEVRIEVELGGQLYAGAVMPEWEETRPNGPGCEPVCRHAPEQDLELVAE